MATGQAEPEQDLLISTFLIVPAALDRPTTLEPVIEPLGSAGHDLIVVDLPCKNAEATLWEYVHAVRAVLPDDLTQVVLVGYSFGGFTASRSPPPERTCSCPSKETMMAKERSA